MKWLANFGVSMKNVGNKQILYFMKLDFSGYTYIIINEDLINTFYHLLLALKCSYIICYRSEHIAFKT